jgi:hypothetical protein
MYSFASLGVAGVEGRALDARKTTVVMIMVLRTCSLREPRSPYPVAIQLSERTPASEGDEQHHDEDEDR